MGKKSDSFRTERRNKRSSDPLTALCRLLEAAREREGLEALALADESGLLVAGAGHFSKCEVLAAEAPLLFTKRKNVRGVEVDGVRVLLSAEPLRPRIFESLAQGCQRILGKRAPRAPVPLSG
jgi:hypothetical protein